jgi:sugar O-acyltransferase (sialic acid O-acetyltransferase NeuD family)
MAPQKIVILGIGGTSIDILDTINDINRACAEPKYECVGFLDDDQSNSGRVTCDVKVLGSLSAASQCRSAADAWFINGIGTSSNFWKKEDIIAKTGIPLERFISLVHPSASVSKTSTIGHGTVVFQNVTITSDVRIGHHVVILPNTVVSHNDTIGDYTCVGGGVCVSGLVTIGKACYLGSNCSIRERVKIADYCVIGMGSVVLDDVAEDSVVVGTPAALLRKTRPAQCGP